MSTITETTEVRAGDRSETSHTSDEGGFRTRRLVSILVAIVVLGWSAVELVSLVSRHMMGPELYGVLIAALAVIAGVLNLALIRSEERRSWATVAVLILWGLVALGGLAGTVAHVVGPVPGHGPVDLRPRPIPAPLIFTVLGLAGGAALWFGQRRRRTGPIDERREE